ncbi:hypothetical protein AVEN_241621-1 [Araneus ventricosus]|uniref:Uncharacterized protein n=1 Tax=Araneus ventricosus TaxID=182803 RepID=A0A4Y2SQH7_ARAVE|nr:hypothetical protein AVEN_241621-1 [Araneus ventricosus]
MEGERRDNVRYRTRAFLHTYFASIEHMTTALRKVRSTHHATKCPALPSWYFQTLTVPYKLLLKSILTNNLLGTDFDPTKPCYADENNLIVEEQSLSTHDPDRQYTTSCLP